MKNIASQIYKHELCQNRIKKFIVRHIRLLIVKLFNDPVCDLPIHGINMKINLSHSLPAYLNQFQFYDSLPTRLGNFVREKNGMLKCVDVGANIGDTIAAFKKINQDKFVAVEPNPKFRRILEQNWGGFKVFKYPHAFALRATKLHNFQYLKKMAQHPYLKQLAELK